MRIYVPNPDEVAASRLTIFVPYVKIQQATLIALIGSKYTPVKTVGKFGYSTYFKKRWDEGKTFISIEQDIVVYPGAVEALWDCPKDWCVYDFHLLCHRGRKLAEEKVGVPIGCVKISSEAMRQTPSIWEEPVEWIMCEQNITKKLVAAGLTAHQHYPSVVNANPVLLGGSN